MDFASGFFGFEDFGDLEFFIFAADVEHDGDGAVVSVVGAAGEEESCLVDDFGGGDCGE